MPTDTTKTMLRAAGWACVALVAVLSLLPAGDVSRTGLGGLAEHALAYAGSALLLAFGHRGPAAVAMHTATALAAYAALLELLQAFSPGRHPGLDGWGASSLGAAAGAWAAHSASALRGPGPATRAEPRAVRSPEADGGRGRGALVGA